MHYRTENIQVSQYSSCQTRVRVFSGYEARKTFVLADQPYAERVYRLISGMVGKQDLVVVNKGKRRELWTTSGTRLIKRISKCVVELPNNEFARYHDGSDSDLAWQSEWHLNKMAIMKHGAYTKGTE